MVIAPGVVATNAHVVQGGADILVLDQGRGYYVSGFILAPEMDLCLLRVPGLPTPPTSLMAKGPELNQPVVLVGYPKEPDLERQEPLADGRSRYRQYQSRGAVTGVWRYRNGHLIQTDATSRPGNSGGGIFSPEGQLIGITTFVFREYAAASFGVPATWAYGLLSRPWVEGTNIAHCKPREVMLYELLERLTEAPENRVPWEAFSRTWVSTRPNDPEAWYSLGHALHVRLESMIETGSMPDASFQQASVEAYRKALSLNPGHARSWNNIGVAYDFQGQSLQASEAFRRATTLQPDYGLAWLNLGGSLINERRWDAAREALRKGLRLVPTEPSSWTRLALCELNLNEIPGALSAFRIALRYRPWSQALWDESIQAMLQRGAFKEAQGLIEDLNRLHPSAAKDWQERLQRLRGGR